MKSGSEVTQPGTQRDGTMKRVPAFCRREKEQLSSLVIVMNTVYCLAGIDFSHTLNGVKYKSHPISGIASTMWKTYVEYRLYYGSDHLDVFI